MTCEISMSKIRVFLDTNVILEAIRIKLWATICDKYAIETVEKCIEEALTGNPDSQNHTLVQPAILRNGLTARHKVPILYIFQKSRGN